MSVALVPCDLVGECSKAGRRFRETEEVDLKLPPKPMSDAVAEKKVEEKKKKPD